MRLQLEPQQTTPHEAAVGVQPAHDATTAPPTITCRTPVPKKKKQRGGEEDIKRAWKHYYRQQGWHKIARFNDKGRLGTPYILFKAKNVVDPAIREEKWRKARPIAPTFHHPMKELLHVAGRAWYFLVKTMGGEHFIINSTGDVPALFKQAMGHFEGKEIDACVLDIEGCFPNMPKDKITFAMQAIVEEARRQGRTGISVPTRKSHKFTWKKVENGPYKWIAFTTMLDVLHFSLNQAILSMKDGRLLRQVKGIPMGDALSPAMTIGTCAWMEKEWMESLHLDVKKRFIAKRYMDDILLLYEKHGWDSARFYADFQRSECYMPPLKLEEAEAGVFLESSFWVQGSYIHFRLKNVNEGGRKQVWRYQPYDSYMPYEQKRSTLIATLKKVDRMAGNKSERFVSAMHKLKEFADLGYPVRVRQYACYRVERETGQRIWLAVAKQQSAM